jgi:cell filamentation protein, protein adenylyltransferase
MAGRGRPSKASVYERLGHALAELDQRFGGLPSPKEAESIWADIWHQEARFLRGKPGEP